MDNPSSSNPRPPAELSHQQRFFHYFQHEITALQEQMSRLADTALIGGERSDATDHCLAGIARLSNEVKDASGYLPAYDQRTYAEAIKALQEKLEETRRSFAPKSKFAFKKNKSPSALSLSDAAELAAQKRRGVPGYLSPSATQPSGTPSPSYPHTPGDVATPPNETRSSGGGGGGSSGDDEQKIDGQPGTSAESSSAGPAASEPRPTLSHTATTMTVSSQSHAHIILPPSPLHASTPGLISNLSRCVLDLAAPTTISYPFASLTITDATSSLLVCGHVSGPAHITGVKKSVVVVKTRQFRMHECEDVDVYLHCASRPIIEDCRGIRFSPLPQHYASLLLADQPDPQPNHWDQIDDFKWLKPEQSPHWSLLPPQDRVPDETWRDVVPGGPGWKLDDILRAVGIAVPG